LVRLHQWKWTEEAPWPPRKYVMAAGFWAGGQYESIKKRLLLPVPKPAVTLAPGGFVTIDSLTKESVGMDKVTDDKCVYCLVFLIIIASLFCHCDICCVMWHGCSQRLNSS
jgi:hypothetical protein